MSALAFALDRSLAPLGSGVIQVRRHSLGTVERAATNGVCPCEVCLGTTTSDSV
jgi:hypothetical protein